MVEVTIGAKSAVAPDGTELPKLETDDEEASRRTGRGRVELIVDKTYRNPVQINTAITVANARVTYL